MKKVYWALVCALLGLANTPMHAAIIIDEDFESYADTAAFQAVWGSTGAGVLDAASGNPGKSVSHAGGANNTLSFATINPTSTTHLRLTGQMFDDGAAATKRISIGLRDAAGSNIIEMGFYNAPTYYDARVVLFASGNPNWVTFPNLASPPNLLTTPVQGWHTFAVEISDTTVDFTLDLGSDGTIDGAMSIAAAAGAGGFNQLRLGGPSGITSTGGTMYDNLRLETIAVPEPASAGFCALLGTLCMFRRRRSA